MQIRAHKSAATHLLGAAMTATFFALTATTFAQTTHTLDITENSSDSLTVTYDGKSIVPVEITSDHWNITLPDMVHLGIGEGSPGAAIKEPEATGVTGPWNNVFTSTTTSPFVNLVDVVSDSKTTSGFALNVSDNVSTVVGFDLNGNPIDLKFHDAGDSSGTTVSDNGSTATLGLISLVALLVGARMRPVQAA